MSAKIPITKPSITNLEIEYVNDAVTNGWGDKCYDYINKLESGFINYLGVKHTIATSSCTGALHMAFAAIGIEPGDEVIVPDITWIASIAPITYLGGKPIFIDVLEDTWCINPDRIEEAITEKTKAILIVNLYGNVCEMESIRKIANKYNLPIIEDAAESLGSEYKSKKTGSFGDLSVFSFHGTKIATSGEGGLITTNSDEYFEKINILSNHGRSSKIEKVFWMEQVGYKYNMSNMQAALGLAQLSRIEELINKKIEIFHWYKKSLCNNKDISMNPEFGHIKNIFWMPTLIIDSFNEEKRNKLMNKLNEHEIDSRPFFYPLSMLPMFEKADNPVAYGIYGKGINLPSYFDMTENDVKYVCEVVLKLIGQLKDD